MNGLRHKAVRFLIGRRLRRRFYQDWDVHGTSLAFRASNTRHFFSFEKTQKSRLAETHVLWRESSRNEHCLSFRERVFHASDIEFFQEKSSIDDSRLKEEHAKQKE